MQPSSLSNTVRFIFIILLSFFSINISVAQQNSINFKSIKEYAGFSNAAYQTEHDIRKFCLQNNYSLVQSDNIAESQVSYFLATNDDTKSHLIAVRGTSNVENIFVNIELKLAYDKHTKIALHEGFSQAAQAIYTQIKPIIKPDYTISTTGHSLGGAIASILAMHFSVDSYSIGQVITFGQPKVTNVSGANQFSHLDITRVVTEKDVVPLVPPFDPIDIKNIDIYWHLGTEVILLPGDNFSLLDGINSMLRVTKFTQETLSEHNLIKHQMGYYSELINFKSKSSKLVPYKNNFNIFNLF